MIVLFSFTARNFNIITVWVSSAHYKQISVLSEPDKMDVVQRNQVRSPFHEMGQVWVVIWNLEPKEAETISRGKS